MSSPLDTAASLHKASEAGSFSDKDPEKVAFDEPPAEDAGNVGLHEFDVAKKSGLRVTPEVSKR